MEKTNWISLYEPKDRQRVIDTVKASYVALNREFPTKLEEIEECVNNVIQGMTEAGLPTGKTDQHGRTPVRRMNIYTDMKGSNLITVDIHEGTTPFLMTHPINGKQLKSLCYIVPQDCEPEAEFFKPTKEELKKIPKNLHDHCKKGGLILRKIGTGKEDSLSFSERVSLMKNKNTKAKIELKEIYFFLEKEEFYEDVEDRNVYFFDISSYWYLMISFSVNSGEIFIDLDFFSTSIDNANDIELLQNEKVASLQDFKERVFVFVELIRILHKEDESSFNKAKVLTSVETLKNSIKNGK